ncbi:MAG: DNA adenine methylase, partial [Pseudomonadota bacterium]
LAGVVVECRPWANVVDRYDDATTLVYLDPPYLHDVRTARSTDGYRHEMDEQDHRTLAAWATTCASMVVLSHYDHPLYRELYDGWRRVERGVRVDSGAERVEVLWLNEAAQAAQRQRSLFADVALPEVAA